MSTVIAPVDVDVVRKDFPILHQEVDGKPREIRQGGIEHREPSLPVKYRKTGREV